MEQVSLHSEPVQEVMQQHCMRETTEMVRLCGVDSNLADEMEMIHLQVRVRKSRSTNQVVTGLLWLRDRLLASCEGEGISTSITRRWTTNFLLVR